MISTLVGPGRRPGPRSAHRTRLATCRSAQSLIPADRAPGEPPTLASSSSQGGHLPRPRPSGARHARDLPHRSLPRRCRHRRLRPRRLHERLGRRRRGPAERHPPRPDPGEPLADPPLFGLVRGGAPWVISEGTARLRANGDLSVEVEGLVIPTRGDNPLATLSATVVCNGRDLRMTSPVPFSTSGDAVIDTHVTLPERCLAPVVLLNPLGNAGTYIAATGR